MSHFDDLIMPTTLKYRSDGRTKSLDNTLEIKLPNGDRKVIQRYDEKLRMISGSYIHEASDADIYTVNNIWEICGREHSFLMRDWSLWNTTITNVEDGDESLVSFTDQPMRNTVTGQYTGDGSTTDFYLGINFQEGSQVKFKRIRKPDISTVVIGQGGSEITGSPSFFIDSTGIVTMDVPPGNGVSMTWGGVFYFPVHFTDDDIYGISYPFKNVREISGLKMLEARLKDT